MLIARDFLGDDDFVMYLGDNMLQQGLADVRRPLRGRAAPRRRADAGGPAPPAGRPDPAVPGADPQRFGVAEVDEAGHVVRLVEKPADPPSNLALAGVYLFTPAIHEAVRVDRAVGAR